MKRVEKIHHMLFSCITAIKGGGDTTEEEEVEEEATKLSCPSYTF